MFGNYHHFFIYFLFSCFYKLFCYCILGISMASSHSARYCIQEFLGSLRRLKCYHNFSRLCIYSSSSAFRFPFSKSSGYMSCEFQVFNGLFRTAVSLHESYPGSASPCVDILVTECGLHDLSQRARCTS